MSLDSVAGSASNGLPAAAMPTPLYATPAGMERPLRLLLVVPERIPRWLSTFVDMACDTSWIDVSVLQAAGATSPTVRALPIDIKALLALEHPRGERSRTLAPVPIRRRDGLEFSSEIAIDADREQMQSQVSAMHPELILSLGPQAWAEPLADLAKWGCWNLDADLVDPAHAGIALLAPVLRHASSTEIELQLELHRRSAPPIRLAASSGATQRGSFARQREHAFLKLPMLLLRALHRLGENELPLPRYQSAQLRLAPPARSLGLAAGMRGLAIAARTRAAWQWTKRRKLVPWLLVLRQDSEPLDPAAPEVASTTLIKAPPGSYWADPCMVEASGRRLLFVEELESTTRKGVIACLEVFPDAVGRVGLALEEASHISYPQVFAWEGGWYMTVESSHARRVSLYRASGFPLEWNRVADLVTGRACTDPTLCFHDDRWYLFTTVSENGNSAWDELFLFVGDSPFGPFHPHPANPIVSDVRHARCAGRLFRHGDRLIRPAQDCASHYGSAIVFNEVVELTPARYGERVLARLAPDWSPTLVACHTYSAAGGIEVLDARGYPSSGRVLPNIAGVPAENTTTEPELSMSAASEVPAGRSAGAG
jgi:hypothetical protein